MPRSSYRSRALDTLLGTYKRARALFVVEQLLDSNDDDIFDESSTAFLLFVQAKAKLDHIRKSRYVAKRTTRKSAFDIFDDDLRENEDGTHWMNESDFKHKYRMTREALDEITKKIQDSDQFKKGKRGPRQREVKHQLMVLLDFLGQESQSNRTQRSTFKIGSGSAEKCRDRVVKALVSMRDQYIKWPDTEERKAIAEIMERLYGFPHCVGIMDGTLAELAIKPMSIDYSDYNGRKYGFSLTIMVINDHERKIRAYLAGFPGSAHDNRVWKHMDQYQDPEKFFSAVEYILCDTAFEPCAFAIPGYKAQTGFMQDVDEQTFNTAMATPRVISEHTMGLWKGRFPWMRKIRMNVTDDPKSLKRILMYIDASIILHNMLIELGDTSAGKDWDCDADVSDLDDATRTPEKEVLDMPLPPGAGKGSRREQLKNYIRETFVPKRNYRPLYRDDDSITDFDDL